MQDASDGEDGLCTNIEKTEIERPKGQWPQHWGDTIHEEDGGADIFGTNPQNGQELLRVMLAKLLMKDGVFTATDDVSGVELKPELMKAARQGEMEFFSNMHVYDRVPREHRI